MSGFIRQEFQYTKSQVVKEVGMAFLEINNRSECHSLSSVAYFPRANANHSELWMILLRK